MLFAISIILFFIGYNFVFKTQRTIAVYKSLAKIEKGTSLYEMLSGESHLLWMKITGVAILLFAGITLSWIIFLLLKN